MKNKQLIIFGAVLIVSILLTAVITYAVTQLSIDPSKKYHTLMPVERDGELYINKIEIENSPAIPEKKLNLCVTDSKGITTCCHWDGEKCITEPKKTDLSKLSLGVK